MRSAIGRLAERLERSGARVARASTSLPDLAESARLYMKLLNAARSPRLGRPASTCGLPATIVPIERTPTGLPIGVRIIGPYLEDRTTIALAALIEREFGGFVPPPTQSAR